MADVLADSQRTSEEKHEVRTQKKKSRPEDGFFVKREKITSSLQLSELQQEQRQPSELLQEQQRQPSELLQQALQP